VSQLPIRPSLTHLRKQAKELLQRLREQVPDATLAQAQHALARECGFASWPALKAHVELRVRLPRPVAFHRYSPRAKEAVFFARIEASMGARHTLEPEHVLLGLIRADQMDGHRLFREPAALEEARAAIAPATPLPSSSEPAARVSTGPRAGAVFRAAAEEADAMQHQRIGLPHILIGLLLEPASAASRWLHRRGMQVESLRDHLRRLEDDDLA